MIAALIGLLQSGKSTLLASVSGKQLGLSGGIDIKETIVPVPDERMDWLTNLYKPKKTVHATVNCLDVPGFSFKEDNGRAAARKLITQIRAADMILVVVRAFNDPSVPAYGDKIDPVGELTEFLTEMLLADLELILTRVEKLEKQVGKPTPTQAKDKADLVLFKRLAAAIEEGKPVISAIHNDAEKETIKSLGFLTTKPMIIAVNVSESDLDKKFDFGSLITADVPVINICAKLEYELSQLDEKSRTDFMNDLGIKETASSKFVNACYSALGLISFLTVGEDEVRAWPIRKGTIALDAAGKVHSDIKRGFIRAEIFSYDDLHHYGSEKALKPAGKIRLEGREYVMKDGDIVFFRFNV